MSQFTPNRVAPYKNFRFRIKWDGRYIAGVSKVSPISRITDVIEIRDGEDPGSPFKSPGRTKYDAITLERGVTSDPTFEHWANQVFSYPVGAAPSTQFRKNITLDLFNEAEQKILSYQLYNCWPSAYVALPCLEAAVDTVAIESLTLQIEGWARDPAVVPPA